MSLACKICTQHPPIGHRAPPLLQKRLRTSRTDSCTAFLLRRLHFLPTSSLEALQHMKRASP